MADEVKLDIKVTIPASVEAAADMPTKWAGGLVNNAALINDRRIAKIGDEGAFQSKIAGPSSAQYAPMVDAGFVSESGRNQANIIRSQYKNLGDSYNHWNDKLALAFATVDGVVAKRFVDQVNNSKDNWATAVANKTLRATGDKIRGTILGQVGYWMVGDYKANQMVNHMEIVDGGPYDYARAELRQCFRTGIMQHLTASLIRILDSDMLAAELTIQNDILENFATHFRDTFVAPVKPFVVGGIATDSLFQFEWADPELKFHARVVLV